MAVNIFCLDPFSKHPIGGGLGGRLGGGLQTGYGRGLAVKLRSGKVQVRSGQGLVQFAAKT